MYVSMRRHEYQERRQISSTKNSRSKHYIKQALFYSKKYVFHTIIIMTNFSYVEKQNSRLNVHNMLWYCKM